MDYKKCKIEGCDKNAHWKHEGKKGWCSIHYRRWQRHGNPEICKYASDGSGCISKGYRIFNINGKNVFEHRIIMEKHLGRKLLKSEIIHHKDENTLNNNIENLEIMSQAKHAYFHAKERYAHLIYKCDVCKKEFTLTSDRRNKNRYSFCCRECASVARRIGGICHVKKYNQAKLPDARKAATTCRIV